MCSERALLPVTVVVVNYNGVGYLDACLASLKALEPAPAEVILVDNASTDGSVGWVRAQHPWVRIVEAGENLGYCGGNNLGIRASTLPFVALLNNDTRVESDWLGHLFHELNAHPRAAACSSLVLLPGDPPRVHYAGSEAHVIGHIANLLYLRPLPEVRGSLQARETGVYVGSAVLFRRAALDEVGLLEERFFIYEDELDMSLRLRMRGWTLRFTPRSVVWHFAGTPGLAVRDPQPYAGRLDGFRRAIAWNWTNRRWVCEQRKLAQSHRTAADSSLLTVCPLSPVPGMATAGVSAALRRGGEALIRLYWAATRWLL
ncbi:MAG: glycosyltransferase family 2 protein [Candidatus Eisenbacteria bacterium]|nr:glycosyltransferase family 2 protein [Candidatus Eisenbacteria bacterium]